MKRVTGIGGIFFKARDPVAMSAWYRERLGIPVQEWGGAVFHWRDEADPKRRHGLEPFQSGHEALRPFGARVHGQLSRR